MLDRIKLIQNLLLEALEIKDAGKQTAFLAEACGCDTALRKELEELIQADSAAGESLPGEPYVAASRATLRRAVEAFTDLPGSPSSLLNEKTGDWIGRYKLLRKLGEGGCGVVYVAEQEQPVRRQVALKVIKLGMDTREVVARFEAERQALALMDHSNIAKVFDAGATEAGRPFFVMELVHGVRITDYCAGSALSTRARLELFIKVCQAIQHAHQKGVIHRDIKPSNVLVTVDDGIAVPKVIDFGIAKATEGRLTGLTMATAFEQFLGTPAYMSPEQADLTSADVDTRSDIYSLGVLLYELLTGMTPFDTKALLASGLDELRRTIREKEPMRPSMRLNASLTTLATRRAKTPGRLTDGASVEAENGSSSRRLAETKALVKVMRGDLDWIVMKCLEKDRARRYETASGLARDIERHLNNEPVVARPPSRLYEFRKTVRRHKLAFAATAVVMMTLAAGILVSTWQAVQKNNERQHLKENVIRQYVGNGARLVSEGDLFGSLLWYAEALRLDAGDPAREEPHRIRIASVLRQCPKLLNVISHGKMLFHSEFSPDGSKVLTASSDHTARVWDAKSGKQLLTLQHDGEVYDAQYSKDGQRIITASQDKTARVWDAQTGALLRILPNEDVVWSVGLNSNGTVAAAGFGNNAAQIWKTANGERVGGPLPHETWVDAISFSPDGKLVGTSTRDGVGRLWDVASTQERFHGAHWGMGISFSPDSQRFLTFSDHNLYVRDTATCTEMTFRPDLSRPHSARFSRDGSQIVATSDDFVAAVWDAASGRRLFSPDVRHTAPILDADISPDGRSFVTAGQDTIAQRWSTATGQMIGPPLHFILHVKHIEFNPDGRRILGNSCDQAVRIWDMATGDLPGPSRPIIEDEHRFASPDGARRLLLGRHGERESNIVWIVRNDALQPPIRLPHSYEVGYVSFSRDGRSVVTACERRVAPSSMQNDIFLWDAETGRQINSNSMTHPFRLLYAAFSPDNRRLLTCGFDFTARLWDAHTGQPLSGPLRHREQVGFGAFSPDGKSVVTGSWDRTARVWDGFTGAPLTPPLQHKSTVIGARWSSDLKRLETVTTDDDLQVWDLASGLPLTPPRKILNLADESMPSMSSALPRNDEDLPHDSRPVADLVLLSQLLAVGRIDAGGNAVPLTLPELKKGWDVLRQKYPEQFAATPSEAAAWHRREAEESGKEGNLTAALFHLDRALAVQPNAPILARWRGEVAAALAQGTNHAPLFVTPSVRFPSRDPRATARQIDLSSCYNGPLHWPGGRDFGDLRAGLLTLGGVQFDVRARVSVYGQHGVDLPERVNGIRVGQKCRRLHFLQAAEWNAEHGVVVGSYVLHYADGENAEVPIVSGRDLEDWWIDGARSANLIGSAPLVWSGSTREATQNECSIGLYNSTRENPRPDVEVTSIDFVSKMTSASPFLVALTVE